MPRLKLTKPGFTNFTGKLHQIAFVNGLSVVAKLADLDQIAAGQGGDLYQDNGTTKIGAAGGAARVATSGLISPAQPNTVASVPAQAVSVVTLSQAAYDALPVKNPTTLYVIPETE